MSSLVNLISDSYSELWQMIIRPPRSEYTIRQLGPPHFRIGRSTFKRHDVQLGNARGHKLECSHFRPADDSKWPCVVYCHGNCSSRLECLDALQPLLEVGISVFTLDFSGSGQSEGEYISLGFHEQQDLRVVIDHLRSLDCVSSVGLWGRSMGASTTVLRASEDPTIAACVMDSPFSSLRQVAEELVLGGAVAVPRFLLSMALRVISGEVESRAGFSIDDLEVIDKAPDAVSPALFAVASDDKFVLPHHGQDLHNSWGGEERKLVILEGGHNGTRPPKFVKEATEFLRKYLHEAADSPEPRIPKKRKDAPQRRRANRQEAVPETLAGNSSNVMADLIAMGFDEETASNAAKRHSSAEGALEYILRQSAQECAKMGSTSMQAPASTRGLESAEADAAHPKADAVPEREQQLVEQLLELGIERVQAMEAAKRSSSVEGAVEWLMSQGHI
mmetsp:Transcript_81797/g.162318  ORF Transcript_81797/g.162318 Transcript_81797/m.162318 type:complete len:447 (+) Transcript_81797:95-1435(+)